MTERPDLHRRVTDGGLPVLEINWSRCGHCGGDLFIDLDQISCEDCLLSWDNVEEDAKSYFTDPEIPPCATPYTGVPQEREYEHRGRMYRLGGRQPCTLPTGHSSGHRHPYEVESWLPATGEETEDGQR